MERDTHPQPLRRLRRTALALVATSVIASLPWTALAQSDSRWVASWGTAPLSMPPAPASVRNQPPSPFFPPPPQIENQTLRQIVRSSIGGSQVRVAITNRYGTAALRIGAGHVALRTEGPAISERSGSRLMFRGKPDVVVEAGSLVLSDPVSLEVRPFTDLAIDLYLPDQLSPTSPVTYHANALTTSYLSSKGNHAGAAQLPVETKLQQWFFLMRLEVSSPTAPGTVVTFGDSITDGTGSTPETNSRWPDFFAKRLVEKYGKAAPGVVNVGIAGNRVLSHNAGIGMLRRAGLTVPADLPDDPAAMFGPSGLSRFDQDALLQTGVTHVIVLETINDIGMSSERGTPTAEEIIAGHRALIQRAHARGLTIYGGTLTPFKGAFYWSEAGEQKRQKVNEWIRTSGEYDGVIDFDAAVRDPGDPLKLRADYQPGDWLHGNDAGYKAMAGAIDLALFNGKVRKR